MNPTAIVGHLMFGYFALHFKDAPTAINTCFNNLVGDTSWFAEIQMLTGLQQLVGTGAPSKIQRVAMPVARAQGGQPHGGLPVSNLSCLRADLRRLTHLLLVVRV